MPRELSPTEKYIREALGRAYEEELALFRGRLKLYASIRDNATFRFEGTQLHIIPPKPAREPTEETRSTHLEAREDHQ